MHQPSVEYTPQQNDVAERANRTLVEMARDADEIRLRPTFQNRYGPNPLIRQRICEIDVQQKHSMEPRRTKLGHSKSPTLASSE